MHGIITPESSLPGITHNNNELNAIDYIGAQAYADLILDQAQALKRSFSGVPIINSINWISENSSSRSAPYYQQYLGDELSSLNQGANHVGWFAQDLRLDAHMGKSSYENVVYPEFDKFENAMRYAMITGDTYRNSNFSNTSNRGKANELVNFASALGVGQLLFLNQEQGQGPGINAEIFNLIASADADDYSFLPSAVPSMISAAVYEGAHANRIPISLSETTHSISANGFSVTVNGQTVIINNVIAHPTDSTKIWIQLADRVYSTEKVEVAYTGEDLQDGLIRVTNHTTTPYNPPPMLEQAVVYEGSHANRIALTLSEPIEGVSISGFSVTIEGRMATLTQSRTHPSDPTKLWFYLSDRIHIGEEVELSYDGSGTVQDSAGNSLIAGHVTVNNQTTMIADPAPSMQTAIVYSGSHADRIALTISETVNQVSKPGFIVTVNRRRVSILGVRRHPTDSAKIWITLTDQITPGERVILRYNGRGTVEDSAGNGLEADVVEVTNAT